MLCAILGLHEGQKPLRPRINARLPSQDPQSAMGLGARSEKERWQSSFIGPLHSESPRGESAL